MRSPRILTGILSLVFLLCKMQGLAQQNAQIHFEPIHPMATEYAEIRDYANWKFQINGTQFSPDSLTHHFEVKKTLDTVRIQTREREYLILAKFKPQNTYKIRFNSCFGGPEFIAGDDPARGTVRFHNESTDTLDFLAGETSGTTLAPNQQSKVLETPESAMCYWKACHFTVYHSNEALENRKPLNPTLLFQFLHGEHLELVWDGNTLKIQSITTEKRN